MTETRTTEIQYGGLLIVKYELEPSEESVLYPNGKAYPGSPGGINILSVEVDPRSIDLRVIENKVIEKLSDEDEIYERTRND